LVLLFALLALLHFLRLLIVLAVHLFGLLLLAPLELILALLVGVALLEFLLFLSLPLLHFLSLGVLLALHFVELLLVFLLELRIRVARRTIVGRAVGRRAAAVIYLSSRAIG
jgi:hypothetical protein